MPPLAASSISFHGTPELDRALRLVGRTTLDELVPLYCRDAGFVPWSPKGELHFHISRLLDTRQTTAITKDGSRSVLWA